MFGNIDFETLTPESRLPDSLPTIAAKARIRGATAPELEAILNSTYCSSLEEAFFRHDEPRYVRTSYFSKAFRVAASCEVSGVGVPGSITSMLAAPPVQPGDTWRSSHTYFQHASAKMGWSQAPTMEGSPKQCESKGFFDVRIASSAAGFEWGAQDLFAKLFLGLGWREPTRELGSIALAVPFVLDTLQRLGPDDIDDIERLSADVQLLTADSNLSRKAVMIELRPFSRQPLVDSLATAAALVMFTGYHLYLQYKLAARDTRSRQAWRSRFDDPERGVIVSADGLDPRHLNSEWDAIMEPYLEFLRCSLGVVANSHAPRIRWNLGGETIWDTASGR